MLEDTIQDQSLFKKLPFFFLLLGTDVRTVGGSTKSPRGKGTLMKTVYLTFSSSGDIIEAMSVVTCSSGTYAGGLLPFLSLLGLDDQQ